MDILALILAMRMTGKTGTSGNIADHEDLLELLIKHEVLPAYTDASGAVLVDENLRILI